MDEAGRGVSLKAGGASARHRGGGKACQERATAGMEAAVSRDTHGAGGVCLGTRDAGRRERRGPACFQGAL